MIQSAGILPPMHLASETEYSQSTTNISRNFKISFSSTIAALLLPQF
jgi:hypothetical protein